MTKTPLFYALLSLTLVLPACAETCPHEADRSAEASLDGIEQVEIRAKAGDLHIEGKKGAELLSATGRACASTTGMLEEIQITTERVGNTLRIVAVMPNNKGWNKKAHLDLEVRLPADLPVTVDDTSGDVLVEGITLNRVNDGSGDLRVQGSSGTLHLEDGSGDIKISDHLGDVKLEDGSGDVRIVSVSGSVLVLEDGSGDLNLIDIGGSAEVKDDGSGDIFADGIQGDFIVGDAGSGDVHHKKVKGRVDVPTRD